MVEVDKHHTVVYHAGRAVDWLIHPDGSAYVHVVDAAPQAPPLDLPPGWKLAQVELEEELRIELPAPTRAWFFANGASYQGPLEFEESK